jgi:ribose 5-phosphate isomerase RpiB
VALAAATGLGQLTAARLFPGVRAALDDPPAAPDAH